MKGEAKTGPSPVDRAKAGSSRHIIVEARGIPLGTILTGGNPVRQAVPGVRGKRGRPHRSGDQVGADRGYDHVIYRD